MRSRRHILRPISPMYFAHTWVIWTTYFITEKTTFFAKKLMHCLYLQKFKCYIMQKLHVVAYARREAGCTGVMRPAFTVIALHSLLSLKYSKKTMQTLLSSSDTSYPKTNVFDFFPLRFTPTTSPTDLSEHN